MFDRASLMSLRRMVAFAATVSVLATISATLVPGAVSAANDKELQRVSGTVGYTTTDNGTFNNVVGSLPLPDKAFAITEANSTGILRMPDSSEIGLGQNTKVQLAAFNDIRNGPGNQITINNGALKFDIRHPAGKKANYRFVTPTSQIAVRGTIGLIAVTAAANGTTTTTIACVSGTFTATVGTSTVSLAAGNAITVAGGTVTTSSLGSVVSSFQSAGITSPTGAGAGVGAGGAAGTAGAGGAGGAAGGAAGGSAGAIAGGAAGAGAVGAVVATTTSKGSSGSFGPLSVLVGGVAVGAANQLFVSSVPQSTTGTINDPGYTGTITLSATNPSVISVTPASFNGPTGPFTATISAFGSGSLSATDGTNTVSSAFSIYGPLTVSPTSVSFTGVNPSACSTGGSTCTFTVAQSGPAASITIGNPVCQSGYGATVSANSAPTSLASTPTATTINVSATAVGSTSTSAGCTITVTGQAAQTATVSVNISSTSIVIQGKRQAQPSTRRPQ
jgi:hypothetical protein